MSVIRDTGAGPRRGDDRSAPRLARLYFSPIIHCPSLCPSPAPAVMFADDYTPGREEAAWGHCIDHCWLSTEQERPCLLRYRAGGERLTSREPTEEPRQARTTEPANGPSAPPASEAGRTAAVPDASHDQPPLVAQSQATPGPRSPKTG